MNKYYIDAAVLAWDYANKKVVEDYRRIELMAQNLDDAKREVEDKDGFLEIFDQTVDVYAYGTDELVLVMVDVMHGGVLEPTADNHRWSVNK